MTVRIALSIRLAGQRLDDDCGRIDSDRAERHGHAVFSAGFESPRSACPCREAQDDASWRSVSPDQRRARTPKKKARPVYS
jgi:hypothetical protein